MTPRADFLAVALRKLQSGKPLTADEQTVVDLNASQFRTNLRMDAERREFARRVNEVVRNNIEGHETLDLMAYSRISEDLDSIINDYYGSWPGDVSARFCRLIIDECRRARAVPIQRAVADVRRRLERYPEVLRVIVREAV